MSDEVSSKTKSGFGDLVASLTIGDVITLLALAAAVGAGYIRLASVETSFHTHNLEPWHAEAGRLHSALREELDTLQTRADNIRDRMQETEKADAKLPVLEARINAVEADIDRILEQLQSINLYFIRQQAVPSTLEDADEFTPFPTR